MPNSDRKFCPNVESGTNKLDNDEEEDYSSMANNEENADSGSPSLSEEENNVSDKTPSDRPKLVVDLNIPLQQDRSEPAGGNANYGFEFNENQINDCSSNLNDSKSLAKDKYANESTNDHRYGAKLLGKVLNTSCDTEITIPDDPNMNCNKSKARTGNTNSHKSKENHPPEKIPLEEVHSTAVPIISDNYDKALEAQKEYGATQNGGKDISHEVNTDKLNQERSNGKRFEEYFMPANTHKKLLRGEKLYLTKEKEVATCSGWKLVVVCGIVLLVVVGVLLGVLAGVGLLVKKSVITKGSSLPDSASMSAEAKHSNELPLSSLPITVGPNHPSFQTVPKVLIVELMLKNETFSDELLNDNSKEYIALVLQARKMLTSSFKNLGMNFSSVEVLHSSSDSIIARFIINFKGSEISESSATELLQKYIQQKNNMISNYHVKDIFVRIVENVNTCLVNNGNCSHTCHWNERHYSQTCLCPSNAILSDDLKTCLKKHLSDGKINDVNAEKTTLTPKTTEVPTTHSSLLLVTEIVTTTPKRESSTWTSVSDSAGSYDASTMQSFESSAESHNDFSTEPSVTKYSEDPHETTISESKTLELTTVGRTTDNASDLYTLTSKTEAKYGYNDNDIIVTTSRRDLSMIANLTNSAEEVTNSSNSNNNTSNTVEMVTDNDFNPSITYPGTGTNFSNATDGRTFITVDNVTEFNEFLTSIYKFTAANEVDPITNESSILYSTLSTVMSSNSFDHSTIGINSVTETTTTRMNEETTFNETTAIPVYSPENYTKSDSALNVTDTEYTNVSFVADTYNQTIATSLVLNATNSANLNNNNASPLNPLNNESTVTEHEVLIAQNVTKEQTLVEISTSTKNSSETVIQAIENTEENTTPQISSTVNYDINEDVTLEYSVSTVATTSYTTVATNEVTQFTTANVSEAYTDKINSNESLDTEMNTGENISTITFNTTFDIDVINATVHSEEIIPKRTTEVENTSYFETTSTNQFLTTSTNHMVTSTEKDRVYQVSDETSSANDYISETTSANDLISDIPDTSDDSYISSFTKNSTNVVSSSTITVNVALNNAFTTENIQSSAQAKGIDYITENANVTETELPINNNNGHSTQDSNLWTSSVVASTIEVTDCDNCTTEVVSITEQTTKLLSLNRNESEHALNADIVTSTDTVYNSSDSIMFTTDASSQLVDSNSSQFVEFTTVTELTDISTSDLEIGDDNRTVDNNSSVDSIKNNTSVELGYTLTPENISANFYNDSTEMQLNLNFSDFSIDQLNGNMFFLNSKNVRKIIDSNFYAPNENRSLKDDSFSSNRSEFEISTMDNTDSDIENENQMNTTTLKSEEIVMNETMYSNCSEAEENCGLNFLCTNSSMVVSSFARCDDIWDCEDGSDEVGCEPTSCGIKEVMCSDGSACIKPADICNEVYNCHDKSDEVGCVERTTCDTNRFFCPEGLCIPLAQLCDAVQDCRNGEDEANCSCTGSDVFQCSNSICLSKDVFCDGKIDCQDGSDERGCIKVDVFGVVQVYDHNNQTWKLLCGENWSENDGNYLCQELGFSSALEVGTVLVSTEAGWMERNNYLSNDSTLWTLGVQPIEFCDRNMTATIKCEEYACGGTQNQYRRKRIAGGQESGHLPGQWTSLAVLYNTKLNESCHGEVISPVWILTSSQCLFSHLMDFSDILVRAGIISVNELENSTQERKVKEIIVHPHSSIHRSPALRDYDVALIRVDEPFELNRHVNAICLGEEEIQEGITCFTGSFQNRKSNEESHSTSSLSHLAVSVIDRNSCNSTEHYSKSITNRMICGQTTGSTSLCNNDDGVPLMCLSTQRKYHVAGMLSYQHNCGMYYKQPAVFSNINDMRPFIEMIVGKNRYNISYDSSLYVIPETVDDNTTDKNNITTDSSAIESTVQTELWGSTDNTFNSDDGITEAQINNTVYETTSTPLFVEDLLDVTTSTVMTDTYLLNETNSNQSSDIPENVSNATLLPKLVLNNDEMQHYVLTSVEINEPENITTTVTLEEFELLTEVHSTIPSIQVTNDTEDDNITKERRKALDYAPVNRTIINLVNNTEEIEQHMEVVSMQLTPDNATDNNMNISSVFQTESSSTENTLTVESTVDSLITTQISSDSLIIEPTAEIPNSNITEANVIAATTEIPDLEQHIISDLIQTSVHSEYFSQTNASLNVDNDKQFLKDEYIPNSTNNVVIPIVTENSKDITTLTPSAEDTEENIQNTYESTTMLLKNSEQDVFEESMVVNKPKHLIDYSSNNFASKLENFDSPVSSDNYSQKHFMPSQILTYLSTVSDLLPKADGATTEIVEIESDFSSSQEMSNSTVAAVFTNEELLTTMPQEIEISNDGFDNSTVIPDIQENNTSPELNETVAFESTTFKYYATHMGSECGVQGFEDANSTWPYIGILRENVSCLASIISPKWLLTSYHCLLNGASPNITTWTFQRGYFRSTPKNIVIHPQFETLGIDMALVELEEINLERNSSICLPKYNTTSQHQCETVVWTENMEGESVINYVPASAEPVMNCDISYNKLPVQHICINNISQTCQENGIPLMCVNENGQWQLQGISSPKTCENNSTFIYFDVRFLVPWIENTIILEVN